MKSTLYEPLSLSGFFAPVILSSMVRLGKGYCERLTGEINQQAIKDLASPSRCVEFVDFENPSPQKSASAPHVLMTFTQFKSLVLNAASVLEQSASAEGAVHNQLRARSTSKLRLSPQYSRSGLL